MTVFGTDYANVYDALYRDKDYERECDFIEDVFHKYHNGDVTTILDLGCGIGGHALILGRRGYHVVGVDHSQDMLDIAKRKAKQADVPVEFMERDVAKLDLQKTFDAVICMFAVMSYQITNAELSGVCRTARKHLKAGGIFVFDCWYGPAVLTEKPAARVKEIKLKDKEKIIRFTEPILNTLTHTVEIRFKVWRIREGRLIKETNESHLMRFLFPQEIRYFLEMAGFSDVQFCPFLKLERPLTEHNWNMAVIAEAKQEG